MKFFYYLFGISLGLLVLVFFEGIITFGSAFDFEKYSILAWVVQIMLVVFTITGSIIVTNNELKTKNQKNEH